MSTKSIFSDFIWKGKEVDEAQLEEIMMLMIMISEMCKTPLESVSSEYFSSLIQVLPDYSDNTKIALEYDTKYPEPKNIRVQISNQDDHDDD